MMIIHVMGGLGNQLYQYALSEKLKTLGRQAKLDFYAYRQAQGEDREWRSLELEWLEGLSYEVCTEEERRLFLDNGMKFTDRVRRKLTGRKSREFAEKRDYMPEIFTMDDVYLYGFWGCERYYEDILALLREKIRFPKSPDPRNTKAGECMRQQNSVAIHVRRADYLTVAGGKRYMGICTDAYYESAMKYLEERVDHPTYYIFSDDADFAGKQFNKANMHLVDWNRGRDSLYDMWLMSCCRNHICANSTFSEWGARLDPDENKIMIRPLHHDNYEDTSIEEMHENWKNWILINPEGEIC